MPCLSIRHLVFEQKPLTKAWPGKSGPVVVTRSVAVKSLLLFRRAANYGEDRAIPGAISAHYSEPPAYLWVWGLVFR